MDINLVKHELGLYLLNFVMDVTRSSANPIGDLLLLGQEWLNNKGHSNLRLTNVNITNSANDFSSSIDITVLDTNKGHFVLEAGNPQFVFKPYSPRKVKSEKEVSRWGNIWA